MEAKLTTLKSKSGKTAYFAVAYPNGEILKASSKKVALKTIELYNNKELVNDLEHNQTERLEFSSDERRENNRTGERELRPSVEFDECNTEVQHIREDIQASREGRRNLERTSNELERTARQATETFGKLGEALGEYAESVGEYIQTSIKAITLSEQRQQELRDASQNRGCGDSGRLASETYHLTPEMIKEEE